MNYIVILAPGKKEESSSLKKLTEGRPKANISTGFLFPRRISLATFSFSGGYLYN
jgi:hypothetical protein